MYLKYISGQALQNHPWRNWV